MNEIEKPTSKDSFNYVLDFNTSSAISRIKLNFLIFYIPIIWISGIFLVSSFFGLIEYFDLWFMLPILPFIFFAIYFVFVFSIMIISKLFLILINLIHKPKQGIFRAEESDRDFKFWCMRIEIKKMGVWLLKHLPLPWVDVWAFRWFGVKMDFSSHLTDAWVDVEFIKFGRKITVGQGAVVMSSMIVGKYLIIKECVFDDYTVIGGVSTIAPGTIIGKDSILGALSTTNYKQLLEEGWIYFGIPGIKLKPNKFAEEKSEIIVKRDVDTKTKYEVRKKINIDEDKRELIR